MRKKKKKKKRRKKEDVGEGVREIKRNLFGIPGKRTTKHMQTKMISDHKINYTCIYG